MSKSLTRVTEALAEAGVAARILHTPDTARTAADAALAAGVDLDQIVKSILFQASGGDGGLFLFLTAGGRQVDLARASDLAGQSLVRAEAARVRAVTGFAIGGGSPVGHLAPSPVWIDRRLMDFDEVWAAAGTPHHIFAVSPQVLLAVTGARLADFTTTSAASPAFGAG